ncbi:HlyD family efflux transporter periplasmic adaptor subunit [Massilia sp. MB5]|uniref:HlyD family secretion protein n=1 Tax=Massilia sp. MB5 TaxID=2919578 RepID=UPI001F0DF7CB|nr:HlyD family efflux transporter periplasmic adaptor subunit [Massilia sp. MB5]UMR29041.1 HlyD family efflux transporter periplasmic adaptor subunit [Massilia sp. MB5]
MAFGSYTRSVAVLGQLVPDSGLLKLQVPQAGVVTEKRVREGQHVRAGEVLYVLSGERQSSTQGLTHAAISGQVGARLDSLHGELEKTRLVQQDERVALVKRIAARQSEMQKLDSQIDSQRARVRLSEEAVARYEGLLAQKYIARETLQLKQADFLDQKLRLQELERERINTGRELAAAEAELGSVPLRQQNQLAQIERNIAAAGVELAENEARRRLVITAPQSGIATAVVAAPGQTVEPGKPLLSIVPDGAKLQAHLYAPSRAIGFVKPGDVVLLRYQAFPYQKFGHAQGVVASVTRTALPPSEIAEAVAIMAGQGGEAQYRITVELASQAFQAYGAQQALQAGMLVDADVLQESRRLYEWALEPLYSLSGRF